MADQKISDMTATTTVDDADIFAIVDGGSTKKITGANLKAAVGAAAAALINSATIISALGYTPMRGSNNLSELASAASARTALGLGAMATLPANSGTITTALGYTPLNPASNLSDVANAGTARTNLGLGTMATQPANSATVTTALGYTPLRPSNNLSDLASAATARTNLGLGSMATQNANAVNITGGSLGSMTGSPSFSGTVTAAAFVGNGAGLTGIGAGTGGVINTGSTTIGADSDDNGTGVIDLQTRALTRVRIENDGSFSVLGRGAQLWKPFQSSYDVQEYASFEDMITDIGSTPATAYVSTVCSVTADVFSPPNVELVFINGGMLLPDDGVIVCIQGPISANRVQIIDESLGGELSLFLNNCLSEIQVEWLGAKGVWGRVPDGTLIGELVDSTTIFDSTTAFNAALRVSRRLTVDIGGIGSGEFMVNDMLTHHNPPAEMGNRYCRTVTCATGVVYKITDRLLLEEVREADFDGNHCTLLWDGRDSNDTKVMWDFNRIWRMKLRNVRLSITEAARVDGGRLAAMIHVHAVPGTTGTVSSQHYFENVHIEIRNERCDFGWVLGPLFGGDDTAQNTEFNSWYNCSAFNYKEAAICVTNGQARENKFYGFAFNGETRGKFGYANYTNLLDPNASGGAMYWSGGGGGANAVADFLYPAIFTDINHIVNAHSEVSPRAIVMAFNWVDNGLKGTVPVVPSLTMDTPGGDVWTDGPNATFTTVADYTFTYAANSDTWESIQPDGTVQREVMPVGVKAGMQPDPDSTATYTQIVRTDASEITDVLWMGGNSYGSSGQMAALVVESFRFATQGYLAGDGRCVILSDASPASFINCSFNNGNHPLRPVIARASAAGPLTLMGCTFQDGMVVGGDQLSDYLEIPIDEDTSIFAVGNAHRQLGTRLLPFTDESWLMSRLANVRGISGSTVQAKNFNGTLVIHGLDTSGIVDFATPEDDADYIVSALVLEPSSGAADPGQPKIIYKRDIGFKVRLENAPGPGQSVAVNWTISRTDTTQATAGSGDPPDLFEGLAHYWELNEATGADRQDSVGAYPLDDNHNNVALVANGGPGDRPYASFDNAASSSFLTAGDQSGLSFPSGPFTIGFWIKYDVLNRNQAGVVKWDASIPTGSGADREFALGCLIDSDDTVRHSVSDGTNVATITEAATPVVDTWYCKLFWYDPNTDTIYTSTDDGAPESTAWTHGFGNAGADFRCGQSGAGAANSGLVGGMFGVSIWNRLLTAGEQTAFYNSGDGWSPND